MTIEIVDLPIKMVVFHNYVDLPEGISQLIKPANEIWLTS
jgi:hypothetical protein